jgi:hypothetical protein
MTQIPAVRSQGSGLTLTLDRLEFATMEYKEMIRKLISLSVLIFALPLVSVLAQQKPDYSGTWKLNVAKSEFGAFPGPTSRTDVIAQKEPVITSNVTTDGSQGKLAYTANYSTDGKETTNSIGEFVSKSTARWDGDKLIINSKLKINDADIEVVATWVLAADGKTLTLSSHISAGAMGETDQKLTFEKQDSSAAPAAKP